MKPNCLPANSSAVASVFCTAWSCMSLMFISGPELRQIHSCHLLSVQAHTWSGACLGWQSGLSVHIRSLLMGKVHLGSFGCPSAAMHMTDHVSVYHSHTIAAAQTAIHHQPSSQCRQASWVPPRQGRQPPSGHPIQTCYRTPGAKRVWNFASSGGRAPC